MSRSNGRGDLPEGYRFEEVERRVDHLVRLGTVTQVDYGRSPQARIKVLLDDQESAWIPIGTARNGPNGEWDPPEVDEQVIVVAPSGATAAAYVLGTVPRNSYPVNDYANRSENRHLRWYKDQTTDLYDREEHLWERKNPNADGKHHLLIVDDSEIEQTAERIFLRIKQTSIEVTDGQIKLSVNGSTTLTLTDGLIEGLATLTSLIGELDVTGLASALDMIAKTTSVTLSTHVHPGVELGPELTPPPLPGS